jgi:hypothetical protein
MANNKIIVASIAIIIAAGVLALSPSTIGEAQAQMYNSDYGYDSNYNSYSEPKSSHVEIQKISCLNNNKNINGIDITEIPQEPTPWAAGNEGAAAADATNTQNGNGLADRINFDKNLVNICVNVNVNDQLRTSEEAPSGGGDHPQG